MALGKVNRIMGRSAKRRSSGQGARPGLEGLESRMMMSVASPLAFFAVAAKAQPSLAIGDLTVTAKASRQIVYVPVTLTKASMLPVSVVYATVNRTAIAGTDYQGANGTITFKPGEVRKVVPVQVLADRVDGDRVFDVVVMGARNVKLTNLDGWQRGRVAIRNGIGKGEERPTITVSNAVAAAGEVEYFKVNLSAPSSKAVSVRYQTKAMGGASNCVPADGVLTIAAGATSGVIGVRTNAGAGSADQDFALVLTAPMNGNLASPVAWGKITFEQPELSISDAAVTEGNSGTSLLTFTVNLSKASSQAVTVAYQSVEAVAATMEPFSVGAPGNRAHGGSDFAATSGTLTFAPGQTSKTISVTVNGDTTIEKDEVLHMVLSDASNATITADTAVGTIDNDDLPEISIAPASVTQEQGNMSDKTLTYTVTLSSTAPFAVTVNYATSDGTATAGSDYTATSGTLTFVPGQTSKTIDVAVISTDSTLSSTETFEMTLSNASNGTIHAATGVGTIEYFGSLSDNLAEASSGWLSLNPAQWLAAKFSTGSAAVDLRGVTVPIQQSVAGSLMMKIYSDNNGLLGSVMGTLTNAGSLSTVALTESTFTTTGISLSPNTTYWVSLESTSGSYRWSSTASNSGTGVGFDPGLLVTHDSGSLWASTVSRTRMRVLVTG